MPLEPVDYVNGVMSSISFSVSIFVVFLILYKYTKFKNKQLIYIAISMFGIMWTYSSTVASFFTLLLTQNPLPMEIYFILGNGIFPFTLACWIYVVFDLKKSNRAKIYGLTTLIIMGFLDFIYIFLVFTQPNLIGMSEGNVDIRYTGYAQLYLIASLSFVWIGLIVFLRDVFKSSSLVPKVKGSLILVSLVIFSIASSFDGFYELDILQLIIVRSFVIIASILGYMGWLLPESIKRLLEKEKPVMKVE